MQISFELFHTLACERGSKSNGPGRSQMSQSIILASSIFFRGNEQFDVATLLHVGAFKLLDSSTFRSVGTVRNTDTGSGGRGKSTTSFLMHSSGSGLDMLMNVESEHKQ